MSNTAYNFNPNNTTTADNTQMPQHRMHDSSEPLPGAGQGAPAAVDYNRTDDMVNTDQRLPGSEPNRYGQDAMGEMGGTMATPPSAAAGLDQPPTMGKMESRDRTGMGGIGGGQMLSETDQPKSYGVETLGGGGGGMIATPPTQDRPEMMGGMGMGSAPRMREDMPGQYGESTPMAGSAGHLPGSDQPKPYERDTTGHVGFEEGVKGSERAGEQNSGAAFDDVGKVGPSVLATEGDHHNHPTGAGTGKESAIGEREKVGLGDKMIGKTQKLMGKLGNNPEFRDKGELRETEGKAGVQARSHD